MSNFPEFMETDPSKPGTTNRLYRGKFIQMWTGKVKISAIKGWAENPRIEIAREKWVRDYGLDPDQEAIYSMMKNDKDVDLERLRADICKNGLREPLVLTHSGRLLDGNRRFFAIRYAMEKLPSDHPARNSLETVPVFVLTSEASHDDEERILVEENFAPSLKKEWPDYVKARHIQKSQEEGMSRDDIVERFGWNTSRVKEVSRTLEIIDDFKVFASDPENQEDESGGGLGLPESEIEEVVTQKYQHFNEAQKSLREPLNTDPDFKIFFFRCLHEGKFKNFVQVRNAYKAWNNPEARQVLQSSSENAGKDAKTIVDEAERITQKRESIGYQIRNYLKFLRGLTLENISELESESLAELREILDESHHLSGMIDKATRSDSGTSG